MPKPILPLTDSQCKKLEPPNQLSDGGGLSLQARGNGKYWRFRYYRPSDNVRDEIRLAAIHETMKGLHEAGVIDKKTMRDFDKSRLTGIEPLDGAAIKAIREREALSQAVFAIYLNIGKNQVSDWERGIKKPSGAALKLLTIVKNKGIKAIA